MPGGRSSLAAITRCPSPCALASSAAPITSTPSRRRGTQNAGNSTCERSQLRQYPRRGRTSRPPWRMRTSRSRANPQRLSAPPHAGQATRPAASAGSNPSSPILATRPPRSFAHARELRTRPPGGRGDSCCGRYHAPERGATVPAGRCRTSVTLPAPVMPNSSDAQQMRRSGQANAVRPPDGDCCFAQRTSDPFAPLGPPSGPASWCASCRRQRAVRISICAGARSQRATICRHTSFSSTLGGCQRECSLKPQKNREWLAQ